MATHDYQIAQNHDNAAGLESMEVQPRMVGIQHGPRRFAANGKQYENGSRSCTLLFGFMSITQLTALVSQFGFSESSISVEVTIRLPANITRQATNYNATAHLMNFPDEAEYAGSNKYVELSILVTDIEVV